MFIISSMAALVKRSGAFGEHAQSENLVEYSGLTGLEKVYFVHSIKEDCILFSLLGNCCKAHGFVSLGWKIVYIS